MRKHDSWVRFSAVRLWGTAALVSLSAALALGACGGPKTDSSSDDEDEDDGAVRCDVPALFEEKCSGNVCHSTGDPEDLDLVSAGLAERLIGVAAAGDCAHLTLVKAGDPGASFLWQKLVQDAPACGKHMPPDGTVLDQDELDCIERYILDAPAGPSCETCGGLTCVLLESDVEHCGECGNACGAGMSCVQGGCLDPCDEGLTLCSFDAPACVDLGSDARNCGRCGHRCGPGTTCTAGVCACDDDVQPAAFAADVLPIFESSCGGRSCHSGTNGLTSLDLSPEVAYSQLVGVASEGEQCSSARVVAGAPDDSFLVDKLLGGDLCYGKRMPRQDDALGDAALARVIGWICAGAPDD